MAFTLCSKFDVRRVFNKDIEAVSLVNLFLEVIHLLQDCYYVSNTLGHAEEHLLDSL